MKAGVAAILVDGILIHAFIGPVLTSPLHLGRKRLGIWYTLIDCGMESLASGAGRPQDCETWIIEADRTEVAFSGVIEVL